MYVYPSDYNWVDCSHLAPTYNLKLDQLIISSPLHFLQTQMRSLTPFGVDLFADGMVEDNMTWNFVAGLTIAREILESYGCVVRVISPRALDAAFGTGGTRIELWFPALPSDSSDAAGEV